MGLTIQDVKDQVDYLVLVPSGLTIIIQTYDSDPDWYLEYEDGLTYKEVLPTTPVEATAEGSILILGDEYRGYVAQQVKFNPDQE